MRRGRTRWCFGRGCEGGLRPEISIRAPQTGIREPPRHRPSLPAVPACPCHLLPRRVADLHAALGLPPPTHPPVSDVDHGAAGAYDLAAGQRIVSGLYVVSCKTLLGGSVRYGTTADDYSAGGRDGHGVVGKLLCTTPANRSTSTPATVTNSAPPVGGSSSTLTIWPVPTGRAPPRPHLLRLPRAGARPNAVLLADSTN